MNTMKFAVSAMIDILNDHQWKAVRKMRNGCILNGGVGSGKSRTGLYYYFKEQGGCAEPFKPMKNPKDLYIITTAAKRDKLEFDKELALFAMSRDPDSSRYDNKIVIDSWNNIQKYKDIHGAFFIFDEDRVTGRGKWVKAFLKIARKNNWIILSATPGDKWEHYEAVFIANGFYKNATEYRREHFVYSPYANYPQVIRYLGVEKLERLRNRILIDMDVNKPTESHHIDIFVDYDKYKYNYVSKNRWDIFKEEPIQQAAGLVYVLRKVVNMDPSRITSLIDICNEHDRVIVFYNFDYELDMLKNTDFGREIAEWNGHNHQPIPNKKRWVYLVQYQAGCEGWNCIETNVIVFFSQNYSYKTMVQAAGRIDRINTKYVDLYYYHFKSQSGIDKAIGRALKAKKQFNEKKWVEKGDLEDDMTENDIAEIITRRRRQLLVHSIIYYKYNESIIPDDTWSKWAAELVQLQKDYPELSEKLIFAAEFSNFDGSTGFNLPLDHEWGNKKAIKLLKMKGRYENARNQ